ncbi:MAG: ATP-binding protein [Deltaproteobacteria bacterium]|nr:ATP-binding protein [Deltaproteobacteria bacterium]
MYSRLLTPPKKSFFLFGPRGTGKSSWVRAQFPHALYIDLLESELYADLLAHPSRLEQLIPTGFQYAVIIDEVQRIPELLNEVHRLIERDRRQFVLTGSSARKLRRKGVNLLAGRALTFLCYPLTVQELGADFELAHSVRHGHLPCAYTEEDPTRYLESYIRTYLREEVQQEGLTRNLAAFSRFLEAASFSQASVLNISAVANDCHVERKVVEQYFGIVEDLLMAVRLPAFTKRAKRRLVAHPKFFFFDVGVYRTLRPKGPLDRPEEIEGVAYETLIFQELRALNDSYHYGYDLYYWRTSQGTEVDFICYGPRGIKALEVKRAAKIRPADLTGLRAFLKDYPMASACCVYGGNRKMREGGIDIIPIQEFLRQIPTFLE